MSRIIGIGETIYNITMAAGSPQTGMPSGDVFNAMVCLGRKGMEALLISEVGNDCLGKQILDFLQSNGVATDSINIFEGKTKLSIAHLQSDGHADYDFYVNYPETDRLDVIWPRMDDVDYLFLGSSYVLGEDIHKTVMELVGNAYHRRSTIIYSPNLHHLQAGQAVWLMPSVIDILEKSSLVIMSESDMSQLYKKQDPQEVYSEHVGFYCPNFIAVKADGSVWLKTQSVEKSYPAPDYGDHPNLIGSDDALRAGILYGLHNHQIVHEQLQIVSEPVWDAIISEALLWSQSVAASPLSYL